MVSVATDGCPAAWVPGARGIVIEMPSLMRLTGTPVRFDTRRSTRSLFRTVGAVSGLVPGVDTGWPLTLVAWPRNTRDVAV